MIYVLDNGQDYSAHEIAFVETDELPEVVAAAMECAGGWYVLAVAPALEWRDGQPARLASIFSLWAERGVYPAASFRLPEPLVREVMGQRVGLEDDLAEWRRQREEHAQFGEATRALLEPRRKNPHYDAICKRAETTAAKRAADEDDYWNRHTTWVTPKAKAAP